MDLQQKANILRALCLIATSEASSGHPTSCLSAADVSTVLFDKYFKYDINNPDNVNNDRFILSKGHAAPLLYSVFALAGGLKREKLLTLRKFKSDLEGHPTPRFKYYEASTGSLGQGLSIGAGMALVAKKDKLTYKTYVLLGDGEIAEGQIYEAGNFSSLQNLDNLIAIIDVNSLGQTGKTAFEYNLGHYEKIFSSLGFITQVIDGHNFQEIEQAFDESINNKSGKPFVIIAKTVKGKGVSFLEDREDFHGKAVPKEDLNLALSELGVSEDIIHDKTVLFTFKYPQSTEQKIQNRFAADAVFSQKEEMATREALGFALLELGKRDNSIFVFDGDVANSTYTDKFKKEFPDRFIECFIAEQNMVSAACGVSARGKTPFVATFGAFLTRAFDQIRMAKISGANIKFVGSHAGVSIGEDGPSQMALEDIAMFQTIPDSVILQPCDAVSAFKLTFELVNHKGISYLRTLRPKTNNIYKNDEDFEIGGSKILRQSEKDELVVVASGITVFEALKSYDSLISKNINICVIDAYSIKPLDKKSILACLDKSKRKIIVTVEDHDISGGLGDAVLSAISETGLSISSHPEFISGSQEIPKQVRNDEKCRCSIKVIKLGIDKMPYSGDKESLLNEFGISSSKIEEKV